MLRAKRELPKIRPNLIAEVLPVNIKDVNPAKTSIEPKIEFA